MNYAFFVGCKTPHHVPAYEKSTRAVCAAVGLGLVDLEFNCCGYPMRNLYFDSYILSAARNMAIAEARGLDVMTQCKCCLGSFKTAAYYMKEDPALLARVNDELAKEGLRYSGKAVVKHLLTALSRDVGAEALAQRITRPFTGLKAAVLHGCHALRPSQMTGFDDPWHPTLSDELVALTGAEVVEWAGKVSCCGAPLRGRNDALADRMIGQRLNEAHRAGADVFCVSCPYSFMQASGAYRAAAGGGEALVAAAALYPQLLGLAMGLTPEELGVADGPALGRRLVEHLDKNAA